MMKLCVNSYFVPGLGELEPEPGAAEPHVFLTKRARAENRKNTAAPKYYDFLKELS